MLAASRHRPGGAPRASSLVLARGAAFGGPPGLPSARSSSPGGAVRRPFVLRGQVWRSPGWGVRVGDPGGGAGGVAPRRRPEAVRQHRARLRATALRPLPLT